MIVKHLYCLELCGGLLHVYYSSTVSIYKLVIPMLQRMVYKVSVDVLHLHVLYVYVCVCVVSRVMCVRI